MYRICKRFDFQAAHVLSKHPGRCRFPHGHNYRVEVTLVADALDENDMVCDFQALKAVVEEYLDSLDHAILLNSGDEDSCRSQADNPRRVTFENHDPSSEILAKEIFERVKTGLAKETVRNRHGVSYKLNPRATLEKVRVWETDSAWAEYQE